MEYTRHYREGLEEAFGAKKLEKRVYESETEEVNENIVSLEREFVTVKRQKRTLEEDIVDAMDVKELEDAYAESMMRRVLAATAKQPKQRFDKSGFRKSVEVFYGAAAIMDEIPQAQCCIAG